MHAFPRINFPHTHNSWKVIGLVSFEPTELVGSFPWFLFSFPFLPTAFSFWQFVVLPSFLQPPCGFSIPTTTLLLTLPSFGLFLSTRPPHTPDLLPHPHTYLTVVNHCTFSSSSTLLDSWVRSYHTPLNLLPDLFALLWNFYHTRHVYYAL